MDFEGIQLYLPVVCGGISSVTGAAAFNELNQSCWCFACSFRAGSLWADQSWWGQRNTGLTLSVPFKKRKTHTICSLCSLKNQHFPEFHARFENKTFWKCCLQWDVPNESDHVWGGRGCCLLPHHSLVVWWVVPPAAKATQCFCLKLKFLLSPNPPHGQMSLKRAC